jgi:hypothetical protein
VQSESEEAMEKCESCGNEYDKAFQVMKEGKAHTFDSFECAIRVLAPECAHCGCKIIGHGVEGRTGMFCCAHCARHEGEQALHDRVS